MTCDDAILLIHLHRPGERTEDDERRLDEHLRTCTRCASEAHLVRQTMRQMDLLRGAAEPPDHGTEETRRIMDLLQKRTRPARTLLDAVLEFASRRSVRLVYAAASLVAVASMGLQLTGIRSDASRSEPAAGIYIAYTIDTRPLSRLADLPVPDAIKASILDQPRIEVSKKELERSARLAGQAMLRSLSLTPEQREFAETIISSLGRTSELTVRLGKTGG